MLSTLLLFGYHTQISVANGDRFSRWCLSGRIWKSRYTRLPPREHEHSSGGQCVSVRYSVSWLKLNTFLAVVKLKLHKIGILKQHMSTLVCIFLSKRLRETCTMLLKVAGFTQLIVKKIAPFLSICSFHLIILTGPHCKSGGYFIRCDADRVSDPRDATCARARKDPRNNYREAMNHCNDENAQRSNGG